jgi:NAD dependent epimerase/dehydratase family enzyme
VAAIPGNGKQIYSWIHVQDLARLLYFLTTHKKTGIYNAVAPYPCSLNTLFAALVKANAVKATLFHVPELIIKIMLGGMSIEVLKSARVSSQKIEETGFQFLYPDIDSCLLDINKATP